MSRIYRDIGDLTDADFERMHARLFDMGTSKNASRLASKKWRGDVVRVYWQLLCQLPNGLTDEELVTLTKMYSADRRRSTLKTFGLVRDTDVKRDTSRGVPATVWSIDWLSPLLDARRYGDCYASACFAQWSLPESMIESTLVHAEVFHDSVGAHGHAWVEIDCPSDVVDVLPQEFDSALLRIVVDPSNGKIQCVPLPTYYAAGHVSDRDPKKYRRYSRKQSKANVKAFGHYGDWHLDVER